MRFIMTTQSADRTGIVAALTKCLAENDGFINELQQFGTPSSERFYSRIQFTIDDDGLTALQKDLTVVCEEYSLNTKIIPVGQKTKTALLVSKFDHCLNDLFYRHRAGMLNIDIVAVISNHDVARAATQAAGLPFYYVPISKETKTEAEEKQRMIIKDANAELIVLARYMQVLSNSMCTDYFGRIINIHHSFLPSFKGAKPYHRAYDRGVKLIGATAHYVTTDLDEGPIIEQSVQRVDHTMTPDALVATGRDVEAQTLARAVKLHCEHRVFINGAKTVILP